MKFLEHFAAISEAIDDQGMWDDADGLYYDRLLTPDGTAVPGQGPLDGRHHPHAGGRGRRRARCSTGRSRWASSSRTSSTARAWTTRRSCSKLGLLRGEPGDQRLLLSRGRHRPAGEAVRQAVRRGRVPVPVRPARPVRLPSRPPVRARRRGVHRHDRLRARRVHHDHVRRQLQLAGAALVPAQLPGHQRAGALPPVLRRRAHRRVPDRLGEPAAPRRDRRRPAGPADLDLPRRPGRAAALLRLGRAAAARPGVEGQPGVQRVLPRRQRRRARRRAPDRLDRADRRRDPPPPRRGAAPSATCIRSLARQAQCDDRRPGRAGRRRSCRAARSRSARPPATAARTSPWRPAWPTP